MQSELSPWHRAFALADGAIIHPLNAIAAVRWNTAFAYLDEARGRANLSIAAETLADRIDVESSTLLTSRGPLRASTIVLAAGAYGSPALLLRSGIGPGLEHDLPVGEGLTDHVGVGLGLGWEPTDALQDETAAFEAEHPLFMAQVSVAVPAQTSPAGTWDLFLFPAVDPGYEISTAVFAMKPASRGSVTLTSPDPAAPPAIDHGFLTDERDAEVLAYGVDAVRELVAGDACARYAVRELRPGAEVGAIEHVRAGARGFFHPVGTCAMGRVGRRPGTRAGDRGPRRRRRLDHAHHPAREHQPDDSGDRREARRAPLARSTCFTESHKTLAVGSATRASWPRQSEACSQTSLSPRSSSARIDCSSAVTVERVESPRTPRAASRSCGMQPGIS